jgi:polysaccharide pyruvyl transferase CsaB
MRIAIAGYYGFENLGDELILSTILSQLKQKNPSYRMTVLSASPESTARIHLVKAVPRWNLFAVVATLWRSDVLLLGGGGLIQNKTSNRSLLYYLVLIALARLLQCHVVLYAMGVEHVTGPFWKRWISFLLSSRKVKITVRDNASKMRLEEMGLPVESIHVTADPVFGCPVEAVPRERYMNRPLQVLLIPRPPISSKGLLIFDLIRKLLVEEKGAIVKGALFQPGVENSLFHSPINVGLKGLEFVTGLTVQNSISKVATFDWIISARFHGLVLAALNSRPFIGVGDADKIKEICLSSDMPFLPWTADESEVRWALQILSARTIHTSRLFDVDSWKSAAANTVNHLPVV